MDTAYITVYLSIGGWKAVMMQRDPECGNAYTPFQTGFGAYKTREGAVNEAKSWAADEELPYRD